MNHSSRRAFLANVGRGMMVASVGLSAAVDFGLMPRAWAAADPPPLDFGPHERLATLMQETPPERLLPHLVERLQNGVSLKELLTAAALANARMFGGEDYVGFHTMMALAPAYHMAEELPSERRALPVLKVLYRNAARIHEVGGGRSQEAMRQVAAAATGANNVTPFDVREAVRRQEKDRAEQLLATFAARGPQELFDALLVEVEDNTEVHRVALPYRAWDLLGIVGPEHAHTLLRQSLRYCVKNERQTNPQTRQTLAQMFDQFKLEGRQPGTRQVDDAWVEKMSDTLFRGTPTQAAEAAAAALAEGIDPNAITEAAALAANQLVLRDHGRPEKYANALKPPGSVHGDSIGLHSCDAVNAWRNIARVANPRNRMAAVILAAYQVSSDRNASGWGGEEFLKWQPRPWKEDLEAIKSTDPAAILAEAEDAIRHNDQTRAVAAIQRFGDAKGEPRAAFDLLLRYAISEDGALHAEKFYRTVSEEFATLRPAFRWRQLIALARVTASEHGFPAPGLADARRLLGVG